MKNLLIVGILLVIIGCAAWYVYRARRKRQCIGCPHCNSCHKHCTF